jgi:hypothetical protein
MRILLILAIATTVSAYYTPHERGERASSLRPSRQQQAESASSAATAISARFSSAEVGFVDPVITTTAAVVLVSLAMKTTTTILEVRFTLVPAAAMRRPSARPPAIRRPPLPTPLF